VEPNFAPTIIQSAAMCEICPRDRMSGCALAGNDGTAMNIRMSYRGWKGRKPVAGRHRVYPNRRSGAGLWLIPALVATGLAGWMFARAEAANPPRESPAANAMSAPASLPTDVQHAAPSVVPDKIPSHDAASPGQNIQQRNIRESNIAPSESSGDEEGISRSPARAAHAVASVDGLKVVRQRLRRGGLGSKALMTLTIRNSNDYPVKHIQLLCAFSSRDGSYVTRRRHEIDGIVKPNSRKTFRHLMVGFVSINANRAKCSLLSADWA
jgi:hypothetical protein